MKGESDEVLGQGVINLSCVNHRAAVVFSLTPSSSPSPSSLPSASTGTVLFPSASINGEKALNSWTLRCPVEQHSAVCAFLTAQLYVDFPEPER